MSRSEAFKKGYDWAKKELENGVSPDAIEVLVDGESGLTDFDRGAWKVLREIPTDERNDY